jgi:hypothetical protein
MKKLFYLFASCLSLQLSAQPVIHHMEDQGIGTNIVYVNCNVLPSGPPGSGQTWDFSTLIAADSAKYQIVTPPASPLFPTANMAFKFDSAMTYINRTASKSYYVGGVDSHSYAMGSAYFYPNSFLYAIRPIGYNYNDSDDYTVFQSSPDTLTGAGVIRFAADAYGTLMTPTGTYPNVLRIKETITENDTIHTNPPFTYSQKFISYVWYNDLATSALVISDSSWFYSPTETDSSFTEQYLGSETPDSTARVATVRKEAKAYLNDNELFISGALEPGKRYRLSIVNEAGQMVYNSAFVAVTGTNVVNIGTYLAPGLYFTLIASEEDPSLITFKFIK